VNHQEVLRFAVVYGFSNIVTVLKQMHKFHYVEIMACPSGLCRVVSSLVCAGVSLPCGSEHARKTY
jgi:hypothetical protein